MKSKAPLALMEQVVMILVFALAATLCVQVFVLSDRMSRRGEIRDRALLEAQNAVETLKHNGGMDDPAGYAIQYDKNWEVVPNGDANAAYHLLILDAGSTDDYLWTADVVVYTEDGDLLAGLPAAGQKGVSDNG